MGGDKLHGSGILMDQHVAYIEKMVAKGGPRPSEYSSFDRWLSEVADELRSGKISHEDLKTIREAFGKALSLDTLQGFSLHKPHGYAGDYEIIDRMYQGYVADDPDLENWDKYTHAQSAVAAICNRKEYFKDLLGELVVGDRREEPVYVLDVASGPARDIYEFFRSTEDPNIFFECVDSDEDAIAYAKKLCEPYLDRIAFKHLNAFRYTSEQKFDVVWSAGLFDYLSDKGFKFLLQNLISLLKDTGELVIGNFAEDNPTQDYMEIVGDWYLHYRSQDDLVALAKDCGVSEDDIDVGVEAEGINLFLHIKQGERFIRE